jgi:hypothetical protein
MRQVAVSVALVSFAAGTFASEGADGLRGAWSGSEPGVSNVVAAVSAEAQDVEVLVESAEQTVPFESVETVDPGAKVGARQVVQTGVDGIQLVHYTVTFVNGVEVERQPGVTVMLQSPIQEIIAVGSLVIPQTTPAEQGSNRALGEQMARDLYGWNGDEWLCLDNLWSRESGWRHTAHNTSSGAYGIPQALPGDKMATFGADWRTNPETQIKWGLSYISGRYVTPCGAWSHFLNKNWY